MKKLLSIGLALVSCYALADNSVGCGPGNFVVQKNSLVATTTRLTTNSISSYTVIGGMTSGTSGCSRHAIVKNRLHDSEYIAMANFDVLHLEMAQGKGEYITSFAQSIGCNGHMTPTLIRSFKQNFEQINSLKERSSKLMIERVRGVLKTSSILSQGCQKALI